MKSSAEAAALPVSALSSKYGPKVAEPYVHQVYPRVLYRPRPGTDPIVDDTHVVDSKVAEKNAILAGWGGVPTPAPEPVVHKPLSDAEQRLLQHLLGKMKG